MLEETPDDAAIHSELGRVCFELKEPDEALAHFETAMTLAPDRAENLYWIGAIRQAIGQISAAEAAFALAGQLHPVLRRPATVSPPRFRLLALFAPFVGN